MNPALGFLAIAVVVTGGVGVIGYRRWQVLQKFVVTMKGLGPSIAKAETASQIATLVSAALETISPGSTARIYQWNGTANTLDAITTKANAEPRAIAINREHEGLVGCLVECFRKAEPAAFTVPPDDVPIRGGRVVAPAYFVPLKAKNAVIGVLEFASPKYDPAAVEQVAVLAGLALASLMTRADSNSKPAEVLRPTESPAPQRVPEIPLNASAVRIVTQAQASKPLTFLLVDSEADARRELLDLLAARGHRVVPIAAEQAADLARRLRFDAVVWAVRSDGWKWSDYQDRLRDVVPTFILVSSGYDAALAGSLREGGGFLLSRPIKDPDIDRVIESIAAAAK